MSILDAQALHNLLATVMVLIPVAVGAVGALAAGLLLLLALGELRKENDER